MGQRLTLLTQNNTDLSSNLFGSYWRTLSPCMVSG